MISTNEIYNVLLLEFPYFKKINEEKRQLLCKRTQHFIEGTDFIPRKGLVLTNRMLILISACSQQLTLAFKKHFDYAYFEKVIVYPEKYLSTHTEKYHTGEMNTAGIIVLSWEDFYKGIKIDNDTQNVGLHEFAHALEFMDISNQDMDERFSSCLDKFTALADHYLQHQPDKPLFRSYATTNLSEFFAVSTEYYFEAPTQFAEKEPALFDILNKAYQQNTAPKAPKYKSGTFTNDTVVAFEDTNLLLTLVSEWVYIIPLVYLGFISFNKPFIGLPLIIIAIILIYKYGLADKFTLYKNKVRIHQPFLKNIIQRLFMSDMNKNADISYSDVLYIDMVIEKSDSSLLTQQRTMRTFSLCYLNDKKIKYAKVTSQMRQFESVFAFLYKQKQVGTRIYGKYQKYR